MEVQLTTLPDIDNSSTSLQLLLIASAQIIIEIKLNLIY